MRFRVQRANIGILRLKFSKRVKVRLTVGAMKARGGINAGWRTIGGVRKYYRSRWEANYARYLEWQKKQGLIKEWRHEPVTFWFEKIRRGTRSYLPDFEVTLNDGAKEYHEVKGYYDRQSKTKTRRMAKYYPSVVLRLILPKDYRAIQRKMSGIILTWER